MELRNLRSRFLRLLAVSALAAVCFAALAAAAPAAEIPPQNAAPVWQGATPADGSTIRVLGGTTATITVEAADPDPGDSVHIDVSGLRRGVALRTRDGNPASAAITVTATARSSSAATITLAARDSGAAPATAVRTLVLEISPPPRISLVGPGAASRWAYVLGQVSARRGPSAAAGIVARVPTGTSQGLPNLVLLLAEQRDARGALWVQVRLAVLPNGSTGWVPRRVLDAYHVVRTHLVVNRARATAELFRDGRRVFRTGIGVGKPASPTPRGEFYVREVVRGFGDPFFGPIAFGTSGRSTVLTDWPGGGVVGIHGTSLPQLLPGHVSHGCVRLRNPDIVRLARLMPLGTPVTIV